MNIRNVNSANSTQVTANYAKQQALGNTGGIFVGGKGVISVANSTDGFQCAGGEATLHLVNKGNAAQIQAGTGAVTEYVQKVDANGKEYYEKSAVKNDIISVGHGCYIKGSDDADVLLSIGQNCDIDLGNGDNKAFVSGEGTNVNGGAGNDIISGTPAGLDYASLMSLDVVSMMAKIFQNSVSIIYKNLSSSEA